MKDFKRGGFGNSDRGGDRGFKPAFKKPWENKGGNFAGKSFGEKKTFGDKSDRPMYQATCTNCGKPCQVPFKPVSGKDVLCNDCFAKARGEEVFVPNDRSDFRSNDRGTRVSYGDRPNFRNERPSFGNDRGASKPWENKTPSSNASNGNNEAVLKQLTSVSAKLDQLISLMAVSNNKSQVSKPAESAPKAVTEKAPVVKPETKPAVKKAVANVAAKKVAVKKVSKKK
jgi:CxxC-x17-CxxC domain-containing protein